MNELVRQTRVLGILVVCGIAASASVARQGDQPEPAQAPATAPASPPPSDDEDQEARQLERRARRAPVVEPSSGIGRPAPSPGSGNSVLRPSPGSLVREGAFLRDRRGRLVAGPEDAWVYVFDADESGKAEPPMVMQPSRRLEEMRHIVESRTGTTTFVTTGQVYVFEGKNHFLPTFFSAIAEPVAAGEAPAEGEATTGNKETDDLLKKMGAGEGRDARRARSAAAPRDRRDAPSSNADSPRLLREGLTISSRRGRVHRGLTGEVIYTTDNSAGSRGGEPPMVLLPCLNLETIQELLRTHGDKLALSMSGIVFVYNERNYLLPTMYRIDPDVDGNVVAAP